MRLEPAGTASPFSGDTMFTKALAYLMNPVPIIIKDSTNISLDTYYRQVQGVDVDPLLFLQFYSLSSSKGVCLFS